MHDQGIAPTIMVARVSLAASIDDPLATRPVNMTMLEFQRYAHSSVNIEPTRIGVVGMNEVPSINSRERVANQDTEEKRTL